MHRVHVIKSNEYLTKEDIENINNGKGRKNQERVDKKTKGEIIEDFGGGINFNTKYGSYNIILEDSKTKILDYIETETGVSLGFHPQVIFGETLTHELIGHGLARLLGSPTFRTIDAIQASNLYLRVTNRGYRYRDGKEHEGGKQTKEKATQIPWFLNWKDK